MEILSNHHISGHVLCIFTLSKFIIDSLQIMECLRQIHTGCTPEVVIRAKKPTFLK